MKSILSWAKGLFFFPYYIYKSYKILKNNSATEYAERSRIPAIGGDFKKYILDNNMPEKIAKLKSGLDPLSVRHVDFCLNAIMNFPSAHEPADFFANKPMKNYYPDWMFAEWQATDAENQQLQKQGYWGGYETLSYAHGLTLLPQKARDYVLGRAIMDLGAFDGDSAMSLSRFNPSKIISFDISAKNAEKQKIKTAGIPCKHEIIVMALSDKAGEMAFDDNGTWSDTLKLGGGKNKVKIDTMDNFMRGRDEKIGLIKADIEGAEPEMLYGAIKTIKRDRPIISVSIYHDPVSFFDIKTFLESLNLDYRFMIRVLGFYDNGPINETTLIAYPAELEDN